LIRIMIVDDHQIVREGLKKILELEHDVAVVGIATSGFESLELASQCNPDIVFMDIKMPGINGIEATRLLCQKYPGIKIIMLTVYDDTSYITKAIQAGARAYVLKNVDRKDLLGVIRKVQNGEEILDPALTKKVFDRFRTGTVAGDLLPKPILTKRELEVLSGLVSGWNDKEVGTNLHISPHTARTHIKHIYKKLGVSSRSQAVVMALKSGLIEDK
jgi:DNA-binding NarL/FixJ family response regulator